jgi:predicted sulfurtransferase
MDTTTSTNDAHSKSLGKWFPTASVIKSSVCYSNDYVAKLDKEKKRLAKDATTSPATAATDIPEPKASLVLFYQYVSPTWSQTKVTSFMNYLTNIAKNHRSNIGGRIRVSVEGVNATVSAASTTNSKLDPAFETAQTLRHFAQDLRQFDPVAFADTDFKYVDGLSADRHFKELKLLPVKELVFYGIKEEDCAVSQPPSSTTAADNSCTDIGGKEVKGGVHLDAAEYHEMLKRKDAVVIDVRNHYEAAIGRFDGQMEKDSKSTKRNDDDNDGEKIQEDSVEGGAQYIDPKMRKSTDFTSWLAEPETKQKLEGKTVLMFCTGE